MFCQLQSYCDSRQVYIVQRSDLRKKDRRNRSQQSDNVSFSSFDAGKESDKKCVVVF